MALRLALCGDVMTGRGIDQTLPHPVDPALWEPWVRDARDYVELAERRCGPIARPRPLGAPWGDALDALATPDAFVVNLETSLTTRGAPWPKGINYRMNPDHVGCLTAARVDVCSLANNHVLDFGRDGLADTLDTLRAAGLRVCGAGATIEAARAPAVVPLAGGGRLLVFGICTGDSGVPSAWAAAPNRSGVARLSTLDDATADALAARIAAVRRPGDVVVVSVHWGENWGYDVPDEQLRFARRLVDGGVDLVHGHSSHHPRPFEVYRDRLVLYGCGDFLNDYEGISGHEDYRAELVLLYVATLEGGALAGLEMVPFRLEGLRLVRASAEEGRWLAATVARTGARFGTAVRRDQAGHLRLVGERVPG